MLYPIIACVLLGTWYMIEFAIMCLELDKREGMSRREIQYRRLVKYLYRERVRRNDPFLDIIVLLRTGDHTGFEELARNMLNQEEQYAAVMRGLTRPIQGLTQPLWDLNFGVATRLLDSHPVNWRQEGF